MSQSEATVEDLLNLLPTVEDLEMLRLHLIGVAVPDPERTWDSSSSYATVDKRILRPEDVERAIEQAEQAMVQHVTQLHKGLSPVFRSFFAGDTEAAARHLIALGECHERTGRALGAQQCYRAALSLSLPLPDKGAQILALRRFARVALALGEFKDATAFYGRSADLARDADDLRGEVISRTGAGNVSMYQGRWAEAEKAYVAALELTESDAAGMLLERGQLFNNLGNVSTRTGRLPMADEWLNKALELWTKVESPVDLAVCYTNLGHLREEQGRSMDARSSYTAGLELPIPSSIKAILAADSADVCLSQGYVSEAEELARMAEEHAITSRSPYTLGHVYAHLGNLARAKGDEDGFTFYEKALQIAREKGYPSLEAETLVDYAELRRHNGGAEEAIAYLERARELFVELGSVQELATAERALAELRAEAAPPVEPVPDAPLAAAGD
ncbi:MAG: tetratricopeptide repeat protein [Gemmatimonadetes bacterium]|nr:tetratricopeptide repeat protein [Gemmatimonadota bacterium]